MYTDYAPIANFPTRNHRGHQVVVVEGGERASEVIALARKDELTSRDADGNEIFWIVFASEPNRVWDFTGRALRRTLWSGRLNR
jgi:hypothetical protein